MSLYLDASVLLPLFVFEDQSAALQHWIESADASLFVSDLAASEFAAAVSRMVRTRKVEDTHAATLNAEFDIWRREAAEPLENLPVDIRAAGRLVRTPIPKLLTPDAVHLATCQRLGLTLVTHDEHLLEIAEREGVIHLRPS